MRKPLTDHAYQKKILMRLVEEVRKLSARVEILEGQKSNDTTDRKDPERNRSGKENEVS